MWDLAALERKLECDAAALEIWNDLAGCKNPFRGKAHEELAKYFEHTAKDYVQALNATREALAHGDTLELRRREERLNKRIAAQAERDSLPRRASDRKSKRPRKNDGAESAI
jgi:hypothetical protein